MIRFLIRVKRADRSSGADWIEHRTLDVEVPELERELTRGGYGQSAYEIPELIGVEILLAAAPRSTETEVEDVKDQDMAFARRAAIAIYDMNRDLPESDRLAAVYIAGAKHHAEAIGSTETGR